MLESEFQRKLKKRIMYLFPGAVILKNDANQLQGIPDSLVLYKKKWAMLETKRWHNSKHQPNQDFYVSLFNEMSYASFVRPENVEEVLSELQSALRP